MLYRWCLLLCMFSVSAAAQEGAVSNPNETVQSFRNWCEMSVGFSEKEIVAQYQNAIRSLKGLNEEAYDERAEELDHIVDVCFERYDNIMAQR